LLCERNQVAGHFEFGQNWRDYAKTIDHARIVGAVEGLQKLLPAGLSGKSFLGIGCGSGLRSVPAMSCIPGVSCTTPGTYRAIETAAPLLGPSGQFALAI
jgi:hypothetical protein